MYFVAIILSVFTPIAIALVGLLLLEKIKHRWLSRLWQFFLSSLCISSPPLVLALFGFLSFEATFYCILLSGLFLLLALFANAGHLPESFVSTIIVAVLIPNLAVVVHDVDQKRRSRQESGDKHQQNATNKTLNPSCRSRVFEMDAPSRQPC
jgi:hypothetical protein